MKNKNKVDIAYLEVGIVEEEINKALKRIKNPSTAYLMMFVLMSKLEMCIDEMPVDLEEIKEMVEYVKKEYKKIR